MKKVVPPVTSLATGVVTLRTAYPLPLNEAEALAAKLNADPMFMAAEIRPARTLRPMAHVYYLPNDVDALESMARFYEDEAREKAFLEGDSWEIYPNKEDGTFTCEGTSGTYELDTRYGHSCSCPDFQYRKKRAGLKCKHLERLDMMESGLV